MGRGKDFKDLSYYFGVVFIAIIFKPEAEEFHTGNREKETNFCWDRLCARHHVKSLFDVRFCVI